MAASISLKASKTPPQPHWIYRARRVYAFLSHPLKHGLSLPWFALLSAAALGGVGAIALLTGAGR